MDYNEMALAKEEKEFNNTCKSMYKLTGFLRILILFIVMIKFALIVVGGKELGAYIIFDTIIFIVQMLTFLIILNFLTKLFKKLSVLKTPFIYEVGDTLKGIGTILIVGAFACWGIELVGFILALLNIIESVQGGGNMFSITACVCGVIMYAFSYPFNYGCKLQKEHDETL